MIPQETDGIKVRTDEKPSWWNREAASGLLMGSWGAWLSIMAVELLAHGGKILSNGIFGFDPVLSADILATAGLGAIVSAAVGAGIGGYIGKQRMEHELREGKPLEAPSLVNQGIATGFAKGDLIALAFDAVGVIAHWFGQSLLTNYSVLFGVAIGTVLAVRDAYSERDKLAQEYERVLAQAKQPVKEIEKSLSLQTEAPLPAKAYINCVTPEETALLNTRLQNPGHNIVSFAERYASEQSLPVAAYL